MIAGQEVRIRGLSAPHECHTRCASRDIQATFQAAKVPGSDGMRHISALARARLRPREAGR